jgi:hypothetical protein
LDKQAIGIVSALARHGFGIPDTGARAMVCMFATLPKQLILKAKIMAESSTNPQKIRDLLPLMTISCHFLKQDGPAEEHTPGATSPLYLLALRQLHL